MTKGQFLADRKTRDAVIKNMVDIYARLEQERPELWKHLVANYATRSS